MKRLRAEHVAILAGFVMIVVSIATFDWRLAGLVAGLGLVLASVDFAPLTRRRP